MDMKKILQAMDGVSTKPVEGASDMKKFVSIISEGANPHKVTLPVQMAMQHYQKPKETRKVSRPALIDKYFEQVQEEQLQEQQRKRQLVNQYASVIAERVRLKEGTNGQWHTSPSGVETNMSPTDDDYEINYGANGAAAEQNPPDAVTVDIPLLIRLLEYAREDAKTDMDLHNVAEALISLSGEGRTLSMDDYEAIVGGEEPPEAVAETKKIKPKKKSDPCWTGYHQIGMKTKNGKMVPNCTKKNSGK